MAILLSILASAVTLVACVMAWRARAAAQRLALEMIQLRDRLARAEAHYKPAAAERRGETFGRGRVEDETFAPRLTALEERLRATLERTAPPVSGSEGTPPTASPRPLDPQTRILKHLRHRGYERVRFLEASEEAGPTSSSEGVLVEAERGGVTAKGRVDILPDGSVHMRAVSTVRAFP